MSNWEREKMNNEKYNDPTAEQAIAKAQMQAERIQWIRKSIRLLFKRMQDRGLTRKQMIKLLREEYRRFFDIR